MTNYDVVTKLIGEITPIGETNTDDKRFQNLKDITKLVELLLEEIYVVASLNYKEEYSIKRAADYASNFLANIPSKYNQD